MKGQLVTSPFIWYKRCAVCNRRKTCTVVICFIALTSFFSYLACNKYGWRIRVVVKNPSLEATESFKRLFAESKSSPASNTNSRISGDSSIKPGLNTTFLKPDYAPTKGATTSQLPSHLNTDGRIELLPNFAKPPDVNSIKGRLTLDRKIYEGDVKDNYSAIDIIPFDYEEDTGDPDLQSSDVGDHERHIQLTDSQPTSVQTVKLSVSSGPPVHSATSENSTNIHVPLSLNSSSIYDQKDYFEEIQYDNESDASSWDSGGIRQPNNITTTTREKNIIYENREYLNILNTKPFQFVDTYKNPCWVEDHVETWYMDNAYLGVENVRAVLTRMSAILRLRQERGDYHRLRCLPFFLMIGQPKCGSTDLYEKLLSHPEAIRPPTKEPHWWSRGRIGKCRTIGSLLSLEDYTDILDYSAYNIEQHPVVSPDTGRVYHRMITGEGSMSTFWDNDYWWAMVGNENLTEPRVLVPDYIHHLLPDVKLILILRNPTTRMYSDYLYFAKESKTPSDFHTDVVNGIAVFENCTRHMSLRSCVYNKTVNMLVKIRLRVGLYAVFLEDWLKVFPRKQFYIVRTEEYAADPRSVLKGLYTFLDLNQLSESHEDRIISRQKANTRRAKDKVLGDMLPETRILLNNFYRPMNAKLAEILSDTGYLWQEKDVT